MKSQINIELSPEELSEAIIDYVRCELPGDSDDWSDGEVSFFIEMGRKTKGTPGAKLTFRHDTRAEGDEKPPSKDLGQ